MRSLPSLAKSETRRAGGVRSGVLTFEGLCVGSKVGVGVCLLHRHINASRDRLVSVCWLESLCRL